MMLTMERVKSVEVTPLGTLAASSVTEATAEAVVSLLVPTLQRFEVDFVSVVDVGRSVLVAWTP